MLHGQTAAWHIHAQFILIVETGFHFFLTCLCHLMQSNHGVRGLLVTEKQNRVCKEYENRLIYSWQTQNCKKQSSVAQDVSITKAENKQRHLQDKTSYLI